MRSRVGNKYYGGFNGVRECGMFRACFKDKLDGGIYIFPLRPFFYFSVVADDGSNCNL